MASLSHAGILTLASLAKAAGPPNPRKSQGSSVWRIPGPSLTFFPLSCIGPFFWGEMVPSAWVRGHRGGAWATGGQKELCQCVFIRWPGEGTVLRESVGTPGCGSLENVVSPSVLELICP